MTIKWIIVLAMATFIQCHQNNDFIVDYFTDLKRVDHCVVFTCDDYHHAAVDLMKRFSKLNIRSTIVGSMKAQTIAQILTIRHYGTSGVVVNCACDDYTEVLNQASDYKFFNLTHEWLILDPLNYGLNTILQPVVNINVNSQITFVGLRANDSRLHLIDVYSRGRHLLDTLFVQTYAEWDQVRRFTILHSFPSLYHKSYRGNFENLTLTAGIVIDRDNIHPKDVARIFSEEERPKGVSPFQKHYYELVKIMAENYNFTLYYKRVARGWAGRLPSGYRLGILGAIARAEVDIGATASFAKPNRHDEFDAYHQSWQFEIKFYYLITPEVIKSRGSANFLAPFALSVWLLIVIMVLVVIFVLKITILYVPDLSESVTSLTLKSVSVIAQQGVHLTTTNFRIRFIFFTLIVSTFLLYNYYSSIVVSNLLSENVHGPETVPDIIESKLKVAFMDFGYHKIMFKEKKFKFVEEVYQKKVATLKHPDIYKDVVTGVQLIKTGEYAFHSEPADVQHIIAKQLDAKEICDLRAIPGLFPKIKLSIIQPKRSQYTEMLKISAMRLQEVGLVTRSLKHTQASSLTCQGTATIHPLTISSVTAVFLILTCGFFLSLALVIFEKLHFKCIGRRTHKKPAKRHIQLK